MYRYRDERVPAVHVILSTLTGRVGADPDSQESGSNHCHEQFTEPIKAKQQPPTLLLPGMQEYHG